MEPIAVDPRCPFCRLIGGDDTELTTQDDVVWRAGGATAIMSPHWWPNNPGHVLVVPDAHHENLYRLPDAAGHAVHDLVRSIAVAMRAAYRCEGITVRQNNEAAGDQDVRHYHAHVLPRHTDDGLYRSLPLQRMPSAAERAHHTGLLRERLRAL